MLGFRTPKRRVKPVSKSTKSAALSGPARGQGKRSLWVAVGLALLVVYGLAWLGNSYLSFRNHPHWTGTGDIWKQDLPVTFALVLTEGDSRTFASEISLVQVQSDPGRVRVLAISPDIYLTTSTTNSTAGITTPGNYSLRQLYAQLGVEAQLAAALSATELAPQQLAATTPELQQQVCADFTRLLGAELGVVIDRYLCLPRSRAAEWASGFFSTDAASTNTTKDSAQSTDAMLAKSAAELRSLFGTVVQIQAVPFLAQRYWQAEPNLSEIHSNFSSAELQELWSRLRRTPGSSFATGITATVDAVVQSGRHYLDRGRSDPQFRNFFQDQQLVLEQARLDVLNGTGRRGLAGQTQRLLTSQGFNVVRISNSETVVGTRKLYVPNPTRFQRTVARLQQLYPDLEVRHELYPGRQTGDLLLVVI